MRLPERPIISGFHPDPSVCRAGEVYYLACSSFEYAPGVPLFRSTDLASWEQIGHALDRPAQLAVAGSAPSKGIFAPTLRYHGGRFWMITTNMTDQRGHLLVTATDPAGPWSDPVLVAVPGIDPDLAWDGAGTCYLTWAEFGAGILQAVLDPATGELLTERRPLWQGTGGKFPEGPHLYRIGELWYLLIAEGGTASGHAATIARGPSPAGPFEPCPHNPVLTARGTAAAVQSTGHADLVQRPDGSWAMVYLGVRPQGGYPQWHVLGRETFASRVAWDEGWPWLGEPIEPPKSTPAVEELAGSALPHSWVAPGRFPADVLRRAGDGWRLHAADADERTFVGRRQGHLLVRARAAVDARDGAGGIEIRVDPRHAVAIEVADGRVRALASLGSVTAVLGEASTGPDVVMELRTEPPRGPAFSIERGPDEIVAGIVGPDGFTELGRIDGRYLSTEVAGGFTGRMLGAVCTRGELGLRSFSYVGADDPDTLSAGIP